jgi:hypothetical protein
MCETSHLQTIKSLHLIFRSDPADRPCMLLFGISYHPRDILSQTVFYICKSGICLFCDIYSEFDNWSRFFYDGGKISIEYKKYKRSQTYFHWKFVGIRSYVVDLTVATILRARIDGHSNSEQLVVLDFPDFIASDPAPKS